MQHAHSRAVLPLYPWAWIPYGTAETLSGMTANGLRSHVQSSLTPRGAIRPWRCLSNGTSFAGQVEDLLGDWNGQGQPPWSRSRRGWASSRWPRRRPRCRSPSPTRDLGSRRKKGVDRRADRRQKGRLKTGVDIPSREEIRAIVAALKVFGGLSC